MKHFKDSNVFIYVRRFAGRRKKTMMMNYSKKLLTVSWTLAW